MMERENDKKLIREANSAGGAFTSIVLSLHRYIVEV